MPRIGLDVLVLFVVVGLSFVIIPGHGIWGWLAMVAVCAAFGTLVGQLGRRYPRLTYGARGRRNSR